MQIKSIVIAGRSGDIEITRTATGATVTRAGQVIAEVGRDDDREARYLKAFVCAKVVYGRDGKGGPAATNSMVHDVLDEIERVADC